jgi:hypothetical protein
MLTEKGHQDMFYGKESQRMATRSSSISTTKLIFQNDIVKNFSSLRLSSSLVEVAKTLLHEIMWTEKGHQEMFYGKESQRMATRFSSISTIKLIFQNDIVKNFSSLRTFFKLQKLCYAK